MRWFVLLFLLTSCAAPKPSMTATEQVKKEKFPKTDAFMKNLLQQYPFYFDSLLRQQQIWKFSIIYTKIDRTASGQPRFTNYFFNIDPREYFYPASTVKMPVAFLSLQKLNELSIPGLDKESTMITESGYPWQSAIYNDPESEDGRPTIANYIKKIFLVSDNEAFNRLYEFLGQEHINRSLHAMGYDSAQIIHRLNISLSEEKNRLTNPVKFYDTSATMLYQQPLVNSSLPYQHRKTFMGKGYMSGDSLVQLPFDFSKKNRLTLADLHTMMQSVIFPDAVPASMRFHLTTDDYRFLYRYMSMKPKESGFPQYGPTINDAYVKFLLFGGRGEIREPVRIFSKSGDAYGFLTDVAYITDPEKNIEFFLSANIYCNTDGIFNDDHYDYDRVGFPFMKHLGEVFYLYELKRKKKNIPDLSAFRIDYSH